MAQDDFPTRRVGFEQNLTGFDNPVNPNGVLSSSSGLDALQDPQFISELMEYYGKQGDVADPSNIEELLDQFYEDQTWKGMNAGSAVLDIMETRGQDERQVQLKGRMKQVFDSLPDAFDKGGRGFGGFAQNAAAAILDPVNIVGFGSGALAAKAAARAATNVTQKQMLGRAAKTGAIAEGVVGVGVGGVQDTLQQNRDLATGIQDEFDTTRAIGAAAAEGLLGVGLGGLFGLAGGAAAVQARAGAGASKTDKVASAVLAPARVAGRFLDKAVYGPFGKQFTLQAENARLNELGFTDAQIAQLVDEAQKKGQNAKAEIATILRNSIQADDYMVRTQEGNAEDIELPSQEEIDAIGEDVVEDSRFPGLQQELAESEADLAKRQVELQQDLNEARQKGDTENEAQIIKELTTVASMEGLATRISNYQDEIAADLVSPNAATIAAAQKRIGDLRTLIADYKNFTRNGDAVTAQAVKESEQVVVAGGPAPASQAPAPTPTATQAVETPAEAPVTEAAPVEAPSPVETSAELPQSMFSTSAVRGMAQNAGLTEADFEGVTPTTKSGKKYNVKDVKKIIASKAGQTPEPATSQPVTAPEAVTPEPVTPEPDVEAASVDSSPIEYIMMQDGEFLLPGYREKTSGRIIVRDPKDGAAISLPQESAGPITPLTTGTLRYRSNEQKTAIQNVLSQIGKTEEDIVEAVAQGRIPVSKDGTIKQIKRPNIIQVLTAFDDVGVDPVDLAYQKRAERVLTKIDKDLGGVFARIVQLRPDKAREIILKEDPEQGDRIFNELVDSLDDGGITNERNSIENVDGQPEFTVTEQKKVKQLTKNMIALGLPEETAELAATMKVVQMRGSEIQKSSGDLEGPLANPPIETTAGRTTFNKIQSFLKSGEFIGRAPSVPEGLDPDTKIIYGYDNAVVEANKLIEEEYEVRFERAAPTEENPNAVEEVVQTRTRRVPNTGVVRYVSTGGEYLADGQGSLLPRADGKKNIIKPEAATRGQSYWHDPITNKAWKNEANMRVARGEGPNQTHYASTDVPVDTDKDILDRAFERFELDGDMAALGEAVKNTGKNSLVPITSEVPDVPVLSTNGKRIALRNKETGNIRVIGQNQIDDGKGLEALLGKADIEDFDIGHTKGARNSKTATEEFEVWSPDGAKRAYLTAQQASQQVVDLTPLKFVQELDGLKELVEDMPMPSDRRVSISTTISRLAERAGEVDKLTFVSAINSIENDIGWPRLGQGDLKRSYAEIFTALHNFRKSIVPDDIRFPGETIGESQRQLKGILRTMSGKETAEITSVLRTLSEQADDLAPAFKEGDGNYYIDFSIDGDDKSRLSRLNHVALSKKENVSNPKIRTVLHELGHWAYHNVLTPEDKLEFWKTAQGYIDADTGLVDEPKLARSLYNLEENPIHSEMLNHPGGVVRVGDKKFSSNHHLSPQEWFATQFSNWAMNERLAPEFREESYWNKNPIMRDVSRYVKSIVDFFLHRKGVDPDLVPIFSKIIPDNLQAAALADGVMTPTSKAGKDVHRTMIDLTMYRDDLQEAIDSGNDEGIVFHAQMLANRLYGIAAPEYKRRGPVGEKGKPFMLFGQTHKLSQTLYGKIYDALGEDVSTLSVSEVENLGFSYDAVSRDMIADADRIRQIFYGQDEGSKFDVNELMGIIINDGRKAFNKLSDEPVKMKGGYPGIEFAPKSPLKGYAKYSKMLRDGTRKKKRIQEKRTKETRQNADAARLNKSPTVAQIDDGQAVSYRLATATQLSDELGKYGETDYGKMVARQMKENERTAPLSNEVEPQQIDDQYTLDAISKEIEETQGISTTNVSPGARPGINLAQEKLSHRDVDRTNIMRTVFYRMANIVGTARPNRRMHLAMMGVSDVNEVARRINTSDPQNQLPGSPPANYLNEQIETDGPEFKELRDKIRSLSTNLSPKSEKATGQKNAKLVVEDVIRAIVIMDPRQKLHQEIWRKTFGPKNQGGQGLEVTQANWDKALNDLVKKVSGNMSGTEPFDEATAGVLPSHVHTVKQHVAYILNGQMDTRLKKAHPVLDAYGNVFNLESQRESIDEVFYPSRYDDEATGDVSGLKRTTEAFWNNSSQNRKDAINDFTGNADVNNPPTMFTLTVADVGGKRPHVLGERGLEPQVTTDKRYGNGTKVRELVNEQEQQYHETMVGALREAGAPEGDINKYNDLLEMREVMKDSIMHLQAKSFDRERNSEGIGHFERQIDNVYDNLLVINEELDEILDGFNVSRQDKHIPVYMADARVFDFTIGAEYGVDDISFIRGVMAAIDQRSSFDTESPINMISSRGYITGDALHQEFVDVIQEVARENSGRPISLTSASERLNKILKDQGYDGIKGHEDGDLTTDNPFTMLFEAQGKIKHAMADEFDDNRHITGYLYDKEEVSRINSQLINTMDEQGQLGESQTVTIEEGLRNAGVSANAASAVGQIARGKVPAGRQQSALRRALNIGLGENSHNMRRFGMNWVADWISPARMEGTGHYERLAGRTSNHVSPVFEALAGLPGGGGIKNWARKASDFNIGKASLHHAMGVDQPRGYEKIVNAIRRGPGSNAVKNLTNAENFAYKKVRAMFQNIHYELTEAGVMVGRVKDYFPQVWSVEKILRDPDNFKAALARYFVSESERHEDRVLPFNSALDKAGRVYSRLVEEDGVYTPAHGTRDTNDDHVDYQRLIRLDEFKEHLDDVGSYLENDLEAIVSKYADNAVRRVDLAEKYGNETHGFYDYMSIVTANSMPDQIAKLLSTKKVSRKIIVNKLNDKIDESLEIRRESPMPFEGDDIAARKAAETLIRLAPKGEAAMRQFMSNFETGRGEPAFSKRMDAIIGAILDRQNMSGPIDRDIEKFAIGTLESLQRKGNGGYGIFGTHGTRASKVVRNFNAITLLGSTVFTSLGDAVLPLVRSGSFKAYTKAMAKYMADPHYRKMTRNIGAALENQIHERMTGLYGADSSKNTVAFFNATLLSPWTGFWRSTSSAVGHEWFKAEYAIALANFNPAANLREQNRKFQKSYRILRAYGLDELLATNQRIDDFDSFIPSPSDSPQRADAKARVQEAVIKFSNQTIFTPNANDIPLFAQSPIGQIVYQLKSFPMMMGRTAYDVGRLGLAADPVTGGGRRFSPAIMLASVAPMIGGGSANLVKDYVQARGEDNTRQPRERSFNELAESVGWDGRVHGDIYGISADAFWGNYVEGMIQMGGLGLLADIFYQTAEQADNGTYGAQRIVSVFGGPTAGLAFDAVKVYQGIADQNDSRRYPERAAARVVANRIPVLGGYRDVREGITTAIAGPPSRGGGASKSDFMKNWMKGN